MPSSQDGNQYSLQRYRKAGFPVERVFLVIFHDAIRLGKECSECKEVIGEEEDKAEAAIKGTRRRHSVKNFG